MIEIVRTVRTKVTRRIVQKEDIITVEKIKKQIRLRTRRKQESLEKKKYSRRQYSKRERLKFVRFYKTISVITRLCIVFINSEN